MAVIRTHEEDFDEPKDIVTLISIMVSLILKITPLISVDFSRA